MYEPSGIRFCTKLPRRLAMHSLEHRARMWCWWPSDHPCHLGDWQSGFSNQLLEPCETNSMQIPSRRESRGRLHRTPQGW